VDDVAALLREYSVAGATSRASTPVSPASCLHAPPRVLTPSPSPSKAINMQTVRMGSSTSSHQRSCTRSQERAWPPKLPACCAHPFSVVYRLSTAIPCRAPALRTLRSRQSGASNAGVMAALDSCDNAVQHRRAAVWPARRLALRPRACATFVSLRERRLFAQAWALTALGSVQLRQRLWKSSCTD
jgi:hypothetical protein